jgi:hypothetical protein
MEQAALPEWEAALIEEAITTAERRFEEERLKAKKRAVQLAREQAYHRLAVAIDRPIAAARLPGQLSLFDTDPTLFDAS